jgi:AraC-like DNA-binding protein
MRLISLSRQNADESGTTTGMTLLRVRLEHARNVLAGES